MEIQQNNLRWRKVFDSGIHCFISCFILRLGKCFNYWGWFVDPSKVLNCKVGSLSFKYLSFRIRWDGRKRNNRLGCMRASVSRKGRMV
ncbi:hypothetical protein CR513_12841, partial [Mucuna pruriens]